MIGKKAKSVAGCPAWMVTYGDCMGLLLCFFIMLVAMSTVNKQLFKDASASIQDAFGQDSSAAGVPLLNPSQPNMTDRLKGLIFGKDRKSKDDKDTKVEQLREGLRIAGGLMEFANGSAELSPAALENTRKIAPDIKGYATKIEVKGHSSVDPLPPGSLFKDHMDLGYARAKAVADVLIQNGVEAQRIRLVSCGASEPITVGDSSEAARHRNNRVEIILTEALVDEFRQSASVK